MQRGWTAPTSARHRAVVSLLLPLLAVIGSPADGGQVSGIDVERDRITVRFDDIVENASSFVLTAPDRIALDIDGVDIGAVVRGDGPVKRIRQARFVQGTTRIVFDMAQRRGVTGGRFSANGRALTLDLSPLADEDFSAALAAPRKLFLPPIAHRAAPPRSRHSVTIDILPARPSGARVRIRGPAGRPLVVIDAGHGGHDPGAIGADGTREKDVTLALARAIRDELLAGGRVRVALTRDANKFLVLGERTKVARDLSADLFISVHADSAPGTQATGASIYTLSEVASGRAAASLAARENRSDIINGVNLGGETSDVSSILIDLAQRETMNASARFADLVKREARHVPFKRDYHQMAGFEVLNAPDTPAILLEAGYISSAVDVERLKSAEGQRELAQGLRRAIDVHFARRLASR